MRETAEEGGAMYRMWFGLRLVGLLLVCTLVVPALADEKELTKEQQERLEKEAGELGKSAEWLFGQGRYVMALDKMKQAHVLIQRLYPSSKFKEGHPELATSLSWMGFYLYVM